MKLLFLLLVIYQIKHFISDYPLQGEYMLGKFRSDWGFLRPLLAHVGVHAAFTVLISIFFVSLPIALGLALWDATIHFIMDRIKASPKYLGRFKPLTSKEYIEAKIGSSSPVGIDITQSAKNKLRSNVLFWWCLGLDQMVHHLTHYSIIYLIILFH